MFRSVDYTFDSGLAFFGSNAIKHEGVEFNGMWCLQNGI